MSKQPKRYFKNATATGHKEKMMPIPTPPNKDLFKVVPPKTAEKPSPRVPRKPSKTTQRISKDIRDLTEAQKDEKNTVQLPPAIVYQTDEETGMLSVKPQVKRPAYVLPEHLTHTPFRSNEALRNLSKELKKDTDPKKPVRRAPKRKSATNKTTGAN